MVQECLTCHHSYDFHDEFGCAVVGCKCDADPFMDPNPDEDEDN